MGVYRHQWSMTTHLIILFSHIACNHLHDYLHQSILLLLQLLHLVPHCVLNSAIIMLYTFPFIPKKKYQKFIIMFSYTLHAFTNIQFLTISSGARTCKSEGSSSPLISFVPVMSLVSESGCSL